MDEYYTKRVTYSWKCEMLHNELVEMDDGECCNRTYHYIGETLREQILQIYSLSDKRKRMKTSYFLQ